MNNIRWVTNIVSIKFNILFLPYGVDLYCKKRFLLNLPIFAKSTLFDCFHWWTEFSLPNPSLTMTLLENVFNVDACHQFPILWKWMHDNGASKVFCTIDIGWFRRVWFDDIVLLFVSTSNFDTTLKIAAHITSFYGLDWSFFELDSPFMTSPRLKSSPRTYVRTQFSRYSLLILHLGNRWDWNVLLASMCRYSAESFVILKTIRTIDSSFYETRTWL